MKQAMWGIGVLAIIVLGLVALITIHGRDIRESEMETKSALLEFQDKYPGKANTQNVDDIVSKLKKRKIKDKRRFNMKVPS